MHNYADTYGGMPPQRIWNASGVGAWHVGSVHGWAVSIMPVIVRRGAKTQPVTIQVSV